MALIFPNFNGGEAAEQLLNEAYEKACDALIEDYNVDPAKLRPLVGTISLAILDFFNAGERDQQKLTTYAVSRALEDIRGLQPAPAGFSIISKR